MTRIRFNQHAITPVNHRILKNDVFLAKVYALPTKGGARFKEYLVQCTLQYELFMGFLRFIQRKSMACDVFLYHLYQL